MNIVACDEFVWNCDGNTYTTSNNTATYTYTNAAGCDSIVTLDLTIIIALQILLREQLAKKSLYLASRWKYIYSKWYIHIC